MNIAICDDQPDFAEAFKRQLEGCRCLQGILQHFSVFTTGRELLESPDPFDVIFLDIRMKGMSGLDAAHEMRERKKDSNLIFLTAYREYVFQAFDVGAYHYLVKPVDGEKLEEVMGRLIGQLEEQKQFLVVRSNNCTSCIPMHEIRYAEVMDRKVYLHKANGEVVNYYDRIERLEKQLPSYFYRCHRSFIVNLYAVFSYDRNGITLTDKEWIPLSKRKYDSFSKIFLHWIQKGGASGWH